jgi:CHASE1-domain containing sensor protein
MYSSIPWVALGISLVITTVVWVTILDLELQTEELEFATITEKSAQQIHDRLQTHEQVLMGFEGLFSASILVESIEFIHFFEIQKINERFPDNQGVGYIKYVSGETDKNELIKRLKDEGLDYAIHPEGTRSEYYPVVFLEPQDFRNMRAIGYDIYSEETRQHAVDQAIKTGKITLTGSLILVQETEKDIQSGFLMLLPVYEYVEDDETPQKFQGLVYSVFRMNDFIERTLDPNIFENIHVSIYDNSHKPENLFYDSSHMKSISEESKFSKSIVVDFGGRQWFFDFNGSLPESNVNQSNGIVVPIIGYTMSFLLFYTFILFSKNIRLTEDILKKEKISLIGELSSRFSHDIRNPLSNIKMAIELIQKKEHFGSNISEKLQTIGKNVDRISHQVDNVLDFIRAQPLKKEDLNLLLCLSDSISTIKIPENIKIIPPNEDVIIRGDLYQIQTVFRNLILNAIQAIGKQEGKITIRYNEEPKYDVIDVEDSGPGFPEDQVNEIFEPLITNKLMGTGLGLVSCKSIIENHHGTITAKNNPTTFTIKLPKNNS